MIVTSAPELQRFYWGLISYQTKDDEYAQTIRKKALNARSETIFESWSYKHPIMHRRCLVPVTGYIEYHHEEDGKTTTPYLLTLKGQEIYSLAGIWDEWKDSGTGKEYRTFSIITVPTEGNELTTRIHNGGANPHRMPLILSKQDEEKWLNPNLTKEEIQAFFRTFPAIQMEAVQISKDKL